jgi:hypothetical protein
MSKEEYDSLLNRYNSMQDSIQTIEEMANNFKEGDLERAQDKYIEDYLKGEPFPPENYLESFFNEFSIIMESEMFLDGQLKGAQLTGDVKIFKTYQINDLEEFIYLLCMKISDFLYSGPIDFSYIEYGELACIVEAIENAGNTIERILKKPTANHLNAIKEKIKMWLDINKDRESSLEWPSKKDLKDLSDDIYNLFKKHIPDASELLISNKVSEFLEPFDISCKPKTLIMRDYRKRKALSKE